MPNINDIYSPSKLTKSFNLNKLNVFSMLLLAISMVFFAPLAFADELHMSFLNPQGVIASEQMQHWWLVVTILLVFVAMPVFVAFIIIMWRYRYSAAKKAGRKYSPHWNFFAPLEFINWGGPLVIVLVLATIVWQKTEDLDPYREIASTETSTKVQVVGYDWKWLFIYPDLGIASVGTLAFPADRPLSMELTTAGNMQALWIPALGSQIYAMAGMITKLNYEAYQPGRFLGMNTMYNGNGFHEQKFQAQAMTPEDFNNWLQNVRTQDQALDAEAVKALVQRADTAVLREALPKAAAADGSVYFSQVEPGFFHNLVMQMMEDGNPIVTTDSPPLVSLANCAPECISGE